MEGPNSYQFLYLLKVLSMKGSLLFHLGSQIKGKNSNKIIIVIVIICSMIQWYDNFFFS